MKIVQSFLRISTLNRRKMSLIFFFFNSLCTLFLLNPIKTRNIGKNLCLILRLKYLLERERQIGIIWKNKKKTNQTCSSHIPKCTFPHPTIIYLFTLARFHVHSVFCPRKWPAWIVQRWWNWKSHTHTHARNSMTQELPTFRKRFRRNLFKNQPNSYRQKAAAGRRKKKIKIKEKLFFFFFATEDWQSKNKQTKKNYPKPACVQFPQL